MRAASYSANERALRGTTGRFNVGFAVEDSLPALTGNESLCGEYEWLTVTANRGADAVVAHAGSSVREASV